MVEVIVPGLLSTATTVSVPTYEVEVLTPAALLNVLTYVAGAENVAVLPSIVKVPSLDWTDELVISLICEDEIT